MFEPLTGVRVIDLSQVLAGPYATYLLALMGAEVLKIEKPGEGDWTRVGGSVPDLSERKMAPNFLTQNSAKKSVAINLKVPDGVAVLKKLIAGADVFVENFKPGVADRLGLGFQELRAINPRLVYCSISAYGQTGPLSSRPAYDHVIQGMSGIMKTTGRPGDGPTKVGAPYVDYATGMNAAMAVLAGLLEARRTGSAVQVDVAMLDTALMLMASLMTMHLSTGWQPSQNGNEAWSASPSSGAFETADGLLMLAANHDTQFRNLCRGIDRADLLEDPRWKSAEERATNAGSLRQTLLEIFRTRTAAEWEVVLEEVAVPAARVRGLEEILHEEQVRARGIISEIKVAGFDGTVHVPNLSFLANGSSCPPKTGPSTLGCDTEEVLLSAGLGQAELSALRRANAI
ncbi:crotonobetainyl-CoA:carnitine CoA-transferase CaiB-like acyl-CoA transferase [Rhizobium petrolearium]|uniref:CaiB/BaiF CoA transferase family protein n=1 Tax=Neorhizobium petrolearium TaxID=515361 RepID=UPI001AE5669E|nr:CoA transferase [Neorhizobium petrolearium]MBP1845759.1 crotonobetainyl-CoA:carnitine CoA-transferase CaiB-like acyl-CoA transferase [Neorhizobium petrolearium]